MELESLSRTAARQAHRLVRSSARPTRARFQLRCSSWRLAGPNGATIAAWLRAAAPRAGLPPSWALIGARAPRTVSDRGGQRTRLFQHRIHALGSRASGCPAGPSSRGGVSTGWCASASMSKGVFAHLRWSALARGKPWSMAQASSDPFLYESKNRMRTDRTPNSLTRDEAVGSSSLTEPTTKLRVELLYEASAHVLDHACTRDV